MRATSILFGTCLGYENLAIYSSDLGLDVLERLMIYNTSLPLHFTKNPLKTKMYKSFGKQVYDF
jgi:hypothetical protein